MRKLWQDERKLSVLVVEFLRSRGLYAIQYPIARVPSPAALRDVPLSCGRGRSVAFVAFGCAADWRRLDISYLLWKEPHISSRSCSEIGATGPAIPKRYDEWIDRWIERICYWCSDTVWKLIKSAECCNYVAKFASRFEVSSHVVVFCLWHECIVSCDINRVSRICFGFACQVLRQNSIKIFGLTRVQTFIDF